MQRARLRQAPKSSSYWLNNTYLGTYIKQETDLFWSCTEQLVMAAADNSKYDWNKSQEYLGLPAEAADIFANADLLRKIAMGQIGLPESGNVVNAGICGRVIGAQDAVPNNNIPAIKVKSSGGTTYSPTFSEAGTIAVAVQDPLCPEEYDTWSGTGTVTVGLSGNWSTPRYQFDGPAGGFPDGNYSIISPSGATIGTAAVSKTAVPRPQGQHQHPVPLLRQLYLDHEEQAAVVRPGAVEDQHVRGRRPHLQDQPPPSTRTWPAGPLGIWLSATGAKDTYYKRTYYFTSNNFTAPSNLQIKVQDGLKFNKQSSSGQQSDAYGYVYSHFGWYRDDAHGYMTLPGVPEGLQRDRHRPGRQKTPTRTAIPATTPRTTTSGTSDFTNSHTVTLTGRPHLLPSS